MAVKKKAKKTIKRLAKKAGKREARKAKRVAKPVAKKRLPVFEEAEALLQEQVSEPALIEEKMPEDVSEAPKITEPVIKPETIEAWETE